MSESLTISEKYSRFWPLIAAGSLVASLLLFGAYLAVSDILTGSYLRLAAFALFVIGFLSLFKLRDGQITMDITHKQNTDPNLDIEFSARDRMIHAETIDLTDIEHVKMDKMPNRSIYNDLNRSDRSVRLQKKNMDGWIYLNEIHGRVFPLTKENAAAIVEFLNGCKKRARDER